jgi:Glycosyltransferase like family 2
MRASTPFSYVLPLRWSHGKDRAELTHYLQALAGLCDDLIIVDGSPPEVFAANNQVWDTLVRHIPPDTDATCLSGKVAGVNTGFRHARHEPVVVADDDVRYEPPVLARAVDLLAEYDLVRPQNYFDPLPWHARWDTARTLLNRAVGADFPGTLAIRRSRVLAMGGYDGDVMFENLELIRTVEAHGGRTTAPLDLYVRRLPPTASHFWGQRTRQAYDDFATPGRMTGWLAILPALTVAIWGKRYSWILTWTGGSVLLAEFGRRQSNGQSVFPATSSLLAPVWTLERGACVWLAILQRLRFGGVRYGDTVIPTAAHSKRALRRTLRRQQGTQPASHIPAATARRRAAHYEHVAAARMAGSTADPHRRRVSWRSSDTV